MQLIFNIILENLEALSNLSDNYLENFRKLQTEKEGWPTIFFPFFILN